MFTALEYLLFRAAIERCSRVWVERDGQSIVLIREKADIPRIEIVPIGTFRKEIFGFVDRNVLWHTLGLSGRRTGEYRQRFWTSSLDILVPDPSLADRRHLEWFQIWKNRPFRTRTSIVWQMFVEFPMEFTAEMRFHVSGSYDRYGLRSANFEFEYRPPLCLEEVLAPQAAA